MLSYDQIFHNPDTIYPWLLSLNFGLLFFMLLAAFACMVGSFWLVVRFRGAPREVFVECVRLSLIALPAAIVPPAFLFLMGRAYWHAFRGRD